MPRKPMSQQDADIGARIRLRRNQLAKSQEWLGDQLGLSFQQIQKYEKGTNRASGGRLLAIANALETTVSALVGVSDKEGPPGALELLVEPGCLDLVQAFVRISDQKTRVSIVALVETLAREAAHA